MVIVFSAGGKGSWANGEDCTLKGVAGYVNRNAQFQEDSPKAAIRA
jgi:hypothetical protein